MESNYGTLLKNLRESNKMKAKDVVWQLQEMGFDISDKTLYGYEKGIRMPNADIFIALCTIYNCKNVVEIFSGIEPDYSIPDDHEWKIIEKYRSLDSYGQETVNIILDREVTRVSALQEKETRLAELEQLTAATGNRLINYYYRLASAGTGQILFDMPPTKQISIPDTLQYSKVSYAIGVNGNSMEPVYSDGDILLVELVEEINFGEIGIFCVDGECYVKKLGQQELISLNPEYKNIPLNEESRCMGKVVDKLKDTD